MRTATTRRHSAPRGNGSPQSLSLPLAAREWGAQPEMLHLQEPIHDWINEIFANRRGPFGRIPWARHPEFVAMAAQEGAWCPPVNVRESDIELILECYLPGVRKNEVEVEVRNGCTLVVRGERRREERQGQPELYLREEVCYRNFYRCFTLPFEVKVDDLTATFEDGILRLQLPKKEEAKTATYRVPLRG